MKSKYLEGVRVIVGEIAMCRQQRNRDELRVPVFTIPFHSSVTAILHYLEHAAPAAERTTVKTSLHFNAISEGPIYGTDRKHYSTLTRGSIKTAPDCAFSLRRLFHGWLQIGKLSHEFITRPGVG
jgi:hypothetical protein